MDWLQNQVLRCERGTSPIRLVPITIELSIRRRTDPNNTSEHAHEPTTDGLTSFQEVSFQKPSISFDFVTAFHFEFTSLVVLVYQDVNRLGGGPRVALLACAPRSIGSKSR